MYNMNSKENSLSQGIDAAGMTSSVRVCTSQATKFSTESFSSWLLFPCVSSSVVYVDLNLTT